MMYVGTWLLHVLGPDAWSAVRPTPRDIDQLTISLRIRGRDVWRWCLPLPAPGSAEAAALEEDPYEPDTE